MFGPRFACLRFFAEAVGPGRLRGSELPAVLLDVGRPAVPVQGARPAPRRRRFRPGWRPGADPRPLGGALRSSPGPPQPFHRPRSATSAAVQRSPGAVASRPSRCRQVAELVGSNPASSPAPGTSPATTETPDHASARPPSAPPIVRVHRHRFRSSAHRHPAPIVSAPPAISSFLPSSA